MFQNELLSEYMQSQGASHEQKSPSIEALLRLKQCLNNTRIPWKFEEFGELVLVISVC